MVKQKPKIKVPPTSGLLSNQKKSCNAKLCVTNAREAGNECYGSKRESLMTIIEEVRLELNLGEWGGWSTKKA